MEPGRARPRRLSPRLPEACLAGRGAREARGLLPRKRSSAQGGRRIRSAFRDEERHGILARGALEGRGAVREGGQRAPCRGGVRTLRAPALEAARARRRSPVPSCRNGPETGPLAATPGLVARAAR